MPRVVFSCGQAEINNRILVYHGVDKDSGVYRAGAVLLDLKEPWRVNSSHTGTNFRT